MNSLAVSKGVNQGDGNDGGKDGCTGFHRGGQTLKSSHLDMVQPLLTLLELADCESPRNV